MKKKAGRNDPCSCGSGKKYKKCCEAKHKYKKFDAKVLSSSAGVAGTIFNQSQSVSGLFNRKIQAITTTKAETRLKERASSESQASPNQESSVTEKTEEEDSSDKGEETENKDKE